MKCARRERRECARSTFQSPSRLNAAPLTDSARVAKPPRGYGGHVASLAWLLGCVCMCICVHMQKIVLLMSPVSASPCVLTNLIPCGLRSTKKMWLNPGKNPATDHRDARCKTFEYADRKMITMVNLVARIHVDDTHL